MPQTISKRRESIYQQIGGAEGVEQLVETFCDILETTEVGKPVYLLHLRGHGMAHARMEQFNFFSGMFGGPKLYAEKWGHSNVRQIHAHVDIDESVSQAWLTSMSMAEYSARVVATSRSMSAGSRTSASTATAVPPRSCM